MPTFDAGAIEATMRIDRTQWNRDLRAAREQIRRFEAKPITAKMDLDAKKALADAAKVRTALNGITDETVNLYVSHRTALTNIAEVSAALAALPEHKTVDIEVNITTALSSVELLRQRINSLDRGPVRIGPAIGGGGLPGGGGASSPTRMASRVGGNAMGQLSGNLTATNLAQSRLLMAAIVTAIPLITSGLGVAVGYATALASSLGAAAGAAVPAGAALIGHTTRYRTAMEARGEAQGAVLDAQIAVGDATVRLEEAETDEERAAAREALAEAEKELADARSGLAAVNSKITPGMEKMDRHIKELIGTWEVFLDATDPAAYSVIATGLDLVNDVLGRMAPLANASLWVIHEALHGIQDWVAGPAGAEFEAFFMEIGIPAMESWMKIGGNLLLFIINLVEAFGGFGLEMTRDLETVTARWADWADGLKESERFQEFLEWVQERGGQFVGFLVAAGGAMITLGIALDPIAELTLEIATNFFTWMESVDPQTMGLLIAGISGASSAFGALTAAMALAWIVARLNPFSILITILGGIGTAFLYAYRTSEPFKERVDRIVELLGEFWTLISTTNWGEFISNIFKSEEGQDTPLGRALGYVRTAWEWLYETGTVIITAVGEVVMWLWREVMVPAWENISERVSMIWNDVLYPIFELLGSIFTNFIGPAIMWVWKEVIVPAWNGIRDVISTVWKNALEPVFGVFAYFFTDVLGPAVMVFWRDIIQPAWAGIQFATEVTFSVLHFIFDALIYAIEHYLGPVFNLLWHTYIQPAWEGIEGVISGGWNNVIKPILESFGDFMQNTLVPNFETAVEWIGNAWNQLRNLFAQPINWVIENVWNKGIKPAFDNMAKAIGSDARLPEAELIELFPSRLPRIQTSSRSSRMGVVERERGGYTPAGMVLVGEQGPELIHMTAPGYVLTAGETRRYRRRREFEGGEGEPIDYDPTPERSRLMRGLDWVRGKLVDAAGIVIDPLLRMARRVKVLQNPFGEVLIDMLENRITALKDWAKGKDAEGLTAGGFAAHRGWPPGINGNAPNTMAAAIFAAKNWPGAFISSTYRRGDTYDHGRGKAVDIAMSNWQSKQGIALGNSIASWFVSNPEKFGTKYVIWRDQINNGGGWGPYVHPSGNRTDPSLRHLNHVHVSLFDQGGFWPSGTLGMNMSGDDEYVMNSGQKQNMDELIRVLENLANTRTTGGKQPLVGRDLILQAAKDESVEDQLEDALFKLRTMGGGSDGG